MRLGDAIGLTVCLLCIAGMFAIFAAQDRKTDAIFAACEAKAAVAVYSKGWVCVRKDALAP